MSAGGATPRHLRLYRALLRLLPSTLRRAHQRAMEAAFEALHEAAAAEGRGALLRLWAREATDLLVTGLSMRLRPEPLVDDVRLALRSTLRHRGFFALASLTLALGVAATTAMYGAFRAVVLEPVPFPEPERLVVPWQTMGSEGAMIGLERGDIEALGALPHLFDRIEEFQAGFVTATGGGEAQRLVAVRMTPGLPELLGAAPRLGRTFRADELAGDGARVLLLSHHVWRARFAGDPAALGRTLQLDGEGWTVVGVMPPEVARPDGRPGPVDVWLPMTDAEPFSSPLARLTAGVTPELAAETLDALARGAPASSSEGAAPRPVTAEGVTTFGATVLPILQPTPLHDPLRVLMVAVSLLLLVACVNVSNLLLHRAGERRAEIAVRAALGAGRGRLVRQTVIESLILAGAGAALGSALAWWALRVLLALRPETLPELATVGVDGEVLAFSVVLALATALVFGLVPAIRGTRPAGQRAFGSRSEPGGPGVGRARWALVASEVALSFALLTGAALAAGMLEQLARREPGYRAEGLVAVGVRLPGWRYEEDAARWAALEEMAERARALPGVTSVALANGVPPRMPGRFGRVRLNDEPRDDSPTRFDGANIAPGFLGTIGQPLVAGRDFAPDDRDSPLRPILLAESTAQMFFPGRDPLGQRIALEGELPRTVVGVVRDIRPGGLADAEPRPFAYWPIQVPGTSMTLAVRAERGTATLARELEDVVRRTEPDAIVEVSTATEMLGATLARERFTSGLLATFAVLALLLASVGLYGVLSQVVAGRRHEIGVRMALGATAARTGGRVMAAGMCAVATGLTGGALIAAPGLALLRSRVFGLPGNPLGAYVAAALALLVVGTAAALVPARRAACMDPVRAINAP